MDNQIKIIVTVTEDGFFTNAQQGSDFVCTVLQPTLDMSLASAMDWIREHADKRRLQDQADKLQARTDTVIKWRDL